MFQRNLELKVTPISLVCIQFGMGKSSLHFKWVSGKYFKNEEATILRIGGKTIIHSTWTIFFSLLVKQVQL